LGAPQERKSSALGSGFIIDEKGIVVTNNHVIQDAEDIIVRVNGDKEFKATVIGADPLSDIAVLQIRKLKKNLFQFHLETQIKQELEIGLLQLEIRLALVGL
jgi:S1-C subfamily serine protease